MTDVVRTEVTITVDGRAVSARPGELLIEAAERAGTYIPRFCYHPRMEPVGVCRMCLVEVDGPRGATLQPACYLRVSDGMNVVTDSEKVKKAQDGVLEFLLANHPLDCPVCDKGGECPLQDQTLAHGSGETRFVEEKRHFVKPVAIGELVLLDRERCIQCARCTRFAAEVAGDAQIDFAGRGDAASRWPPRRRVPFDSVFSGNTVQICPVGALTAKPYRFTARPWDLEQVESTCTTCAVQLPRRGAVLRRTGSRACSASTQEPVNHGWLCDKGRFTLDSIDGNADRHDPLDAATRITEPMVRRDGAARRGELGRSPGRGGRGPARRRAGPDGVGAIGGAALTNEGAFAWQRFVRGVLGSEHLDAQYGDGLDARAGPGAAGRHDRRGGARARRRHADRRPARGAADPLPAPARGSGQAPLAPGRVLLRRERAALVGRRSRCPSAPARRTSSPRRSRRARRCTTWRVGEDALARGARAARRHRRGRGLRRRSAQPGRRRRGDRARGAHPGRAVPATRRSSPALRRANVRGALDMGLAPGLAPGRGFDAGAPVATPWPSSPPWRAGEQSAVLLLGGCLLGNVADVERAQRRAGARRASSS